MAVIIPKEIRPGDYELAILTGFIRAAASRCCILGIVINKDITNVVLSDVMPL
jgi:hypothetical protein